MGYSIIKEHNQNETKNNQNQDINARNEGITTILRPCNGSNKGRPF
jgi:hypothetical protein